MTSFDRNAILARLSALREADAPTHGGHVLSYVYDSGIAELDELAAAAVRLVQPVNGLDPTTFTSAAVMEREVLGFARELLHGGDEVVGSVTSGGTESCLLAVKTAREAWRAAGGDPDLVGLRQGYREVCATIGARVRIELPGGGTEVATAVDVDTDGRLVVRDGSGTTRAVTAGDVIHLRPLP